MISFLLVHRFANSYTSYAEIYFLDIFCNCLIFPFSEIITIIRDVLSKGSVCWLYHVIVWECGKKFLKRKTPVAMTGVFLLGICINYPNGLFNFSSFQIWPLTEYFVIVFRSCSVPGMYSCIICSCRNVLEYSFAYTWFNI